MKPGVLRQGHDLKILDRIVAPIVVFVVDHFTSA